MDISTENFKYYAFISYSHKDKKAADWIHKKLTFYRLPSYAREELHQDIRLRPICRDEHSLPPGPLWEMLKEKLDESRFLIVICSPNSAFPGLSGEHWVNREAEYFAQKHGSDKIIPVIVDGKVDGGNNECFPPALKDLNLLALDMTQKSNPRKKILNFLAAKLLGLNPDMLYDYARQESKRYFKIRFCFCLPLILLLILAGCFTWDYFRHVENYYADYINSYGLPSGIYPLQKADTLHRQVHYRFEYRGYRWKKSKHTDSANWSFFNLFGMQRVLNRVVQANSAGNPIERNSKEFADRPPIQLFEYDNSIPFFAMQLRSVSYRNPGGKEGLISKKIIYSDWQGTINGRVSIESPNNTPLRQKARLTDSKEDKNHSSLLSPITGFLLERDSFGRVTRQINIDAYGSAVTDEDGIGAFGYDFYSDGRIMYKWHLAKSEGNWKRQANKDGVAGKFFKYEKENLTLIKHVNTEEKPVYGPEGWMVCELEYKDGNCISGIYKNENGEISSRSDLEIAGYTWKYNTAGNAIAIIFHSGKKDSAGNWIPVMAKEADSEGKKKESYSSRHMEYDDNGYLVKQYYKDLNGNICTAVSEGCAVIKSEYDDGKISHIYNLDRDEKPTVSINGIYHIHYFYHPKTGKLSRAEFYAQENQGGIWEYKNVHKVIRTFDEYGNIVSDSLFDINQNPAANKDGVHSSKNFYHEQAGYLVRDEIYGLPGKGGVWGYENVHKIVRLFDKNGNQIEERYFDINNKPTVDSNGIHYCTNSYKDGKLAERTFYALEGQGGMWEFKNVHKAVRFFDPEGNITEERYFDINNKPTVNSNGIHYYTDSYKDGKLAERTFYALKGQGGIWEHQNVHKAVRFFDSNGNAVEDYYYGIDNEPVINQNGIQRVVDTFDEKNKLTERTFYALKDQGGIWGYPNVHKAVQLFDPEGNITEEWYFDINNKPTVDSNGIHYFTNSYKDGKLTERTLYALNGQGGMWEHKNVHKAVQLFDPEGNITEERFFDANNKPTVNSNGIHYATNSYKDGKLTEQTLYALNGQGGIWGNENTHKVIVSFDKNGNRKETISFDVRENIL